MSDVAPPTVDGRDEAGVLAALRERLRDYLPAAPSPAGSARAAMDRLVSGMLAVIGRALDAALPRAQLAFLDTCGEMQRPPQAASVALVWSLNDQSPVDAPLAAGTSVAARPSPGLAGEPPTFIVTQAIALTRARLAAIYSVDPGGDRWDDHTSRATDGFTLFEGASVVDHALYLGHDHLFKLPGSATSTGSDAKIILHAGLAGLEDELRQDLRLRWEYWAASGWCPLGGTIADQQLGDGQVDLRKEGGPPAAQRELLGRKSFWIRATLTEPLLAGTGGLPVIDTVRASLDYGHRDLRADGVAIDGRAVDSSAPFQPFGAAPVRGTTFFVGCSEAFGRPGARVRIDFLFRDGVLPTTGQTRTKIKSAAGPISFEYFDGKTWKHLAISDTTRIFREPPASASATDKEARDGLVAFTAPADWKPTTIDRVTSHFVRARLDDDDVFGDGPKVVNNVFSAATWVSPLVTAMSVSFSQVTDPTPVDHCLIANAGVFTDVTQAARFPQRTFAPFQSSGDEQPAVYLCFDRSLPSGLVSLFADIQPDPERTDEGSPFVWEYQATGGWRTLEVVDETRGFRASGMLQLIGPFDHVASDGPGGILYRIRARLKQGARLAPRTVAGLWLNAVPATHASHFAALSLGRTTGEPRQLLMFPRAHTPILDGEALEIREWTGSDRGYEAITETVAEADRRLVIDPVTQRVIEVWVRWRERPHLLDAGADDRVYTLERISGIVRFGDGQRGRIPPAGAPVSVSFATGGGVNGNAPIDAITEARAAVPFLKSVMNPRPARGGSDAEALEVTRLRGAQRVRHRGQALAGSDYEWLAVEASPAVARARCLAITGPAGRGQRGWVTVVIVPHGRERQPLPDGELTSRVRAYLAARAPAAVATRIRVIGPTYRPVGVIAEIIPRRPEDAVGLEAELRTRLDKFLHPLRGGTKGQGWQVGESVPISQVAAVIEGTPGVAFAREIVLAAGGSVFLEDAVGTPETLVAPGEHQLRLTVGGGTC